MYGIFIQTAINLSNALTEKERNPVPVAYAGYKLIQKYKAGVECFTNECFFY